jgi:uncharacterized membrane protein YfcA
MNLSLLDAVLAILVVAIGTAVQASIGFGLAMIAAPLLMLIEPAFVPGAMIAIALLLAIWMTWDDRHAIDRSTLKAGVAGRLLGTPPAALFLGTVSAATFDLVFGTLVLLAVGMSLWHSNIRPTPWNVFFATVASGFMGTISGIGGPPLALVYQNASGAELRANLSVLFLVGTSISLVALVAIGRFGLVDLAYTGLLMVGIVTGALCRGPVKRRLDKTAARPWLLALCALSAVAVLARALFALT